MKITKSRTVQIKQYEPMTVTVEEECTVDTEKDINEMLDTFIGAEVEKMQGLREAAVNA